LGADGEFSPVGSSFRSGRISFAGDCCVGHGRSLLFPPLWYNLHFNPSMVLSVSCSLHLACITFGLTHRVIDWWSKGYAGAHDFHSHNSLFEFGLYAQMGCCVCWNSAWFDCEWFCWKARGCQVIFMARWVVESWRTRVEQWFKRFEAWPKRVDKLRDIEYYWCFIRWRFSKHRDFYSAEIFSVLNKQCTKNASRARRL